MDLAANSFRVFMSQIIDYAGLYPPASLSLEDAIRNFVKYQSDPEVSWILLRRIGNSLGEKMEKYERN